MKDPRSKLYSYAIIAQPIFSERGQFSLWERVGKYKKLEDAEKAIEDLTRSKISTLIYRIVPYFEGHYFRDLETEKREFAITNGLLWDYLTSKGLKEEAREFILNKKENKKKWIFF